MSKKLKKKHFKAIEEIMESFDFEWCADAMKATNWNWGFDKTSPTVHELKHDARKKLHEVIEKDLWRVSSGGLTVTYDKKRKNEEYPFLLELTFGKEWSTW
jgi:hypothetical protein